MITSVGELTGPRGCPRRMSKRSSRGQVIAFNLVPVVEHVLPDRPKTEVKHKCSNRSTSHWDVHVYTNNIATFALHVASLPPSPSYR